MSIRIALLAVAVAVPAVSAFATVYVPDTSSLPPGWAISVVPDWTGRGSVSNKTVGGSNGFQFTQGDANKTGGCRSNLGTNNYDGLLLSRITALRARIWLTEGDQTKQPPHFVLKLQKTTTDPSDRSLEWIPFSDGSGGSINTWYEMDATVDGSWYCPNNGVTYTTLAAAVAAYPQLTFTSSATYFPNVVFSFNLGSNNWSNSVTKYNDNDRGVCDWFEIGVDGVTTRYDLADIPEPSALIALGSGLIGLIGLRRRK